MRDIRASVYAKIRQPSTERFSIFVVSSSHLWKIRLEEDQVQDVEVENGLESELRPGIGSSKSSFLLHRSCRCILAGRTNRATKPSGSYTELMTKNTTTTTTTFICMTINTYSVAKAFVN